MEYKDMHRYRFTRLTSVELNQIKIKCKQYPPSTIIIEIPNTNGLTADILKQLPEDIHIRVAGGHTSERLDNYKNDPSKRKDYFERGIYTRNELKSCADIYYDKYAKTIDIEAKTMIDMASKQYIPCAIKFMNNLAQTINNMNQAMNGKADNSVTEKILSDTSSLLSKAKEALENLKKKLKEEEAEKDGTKKAILYRKEIIPIMEDLRRPIDELELLVDSSLWPVPYYGDLMFK